MVMRSTLPSLHTARASTSPPGASSTSCVSGSSIGMMPVSSNTFVTQMEFDPDIGGVSVGSMMMKPICARGLIGGTSKFTCRKTPPRGSLRTKLRRVSSDSIKARCAQSVSPGGGATPPTITSPTSPSAWQLTTWIVLELRIWESGSCYSSSSLGSTRVISGQVTHLTQRMISLASCLVFGFGGFTR